MRTGAIICECNPPHGGHAYLIEQVKKQSDCVLCLLSGPFVQRGEAAILSPAARAELLLKMGADLVLELPFPYAAASAETFAGAGVSILSRLGATDLWFGSESGDLSLLSRFAKAAEDPAFQKQYAGLAASGKQGTAETYFDLLASFCKAEKAPLSNDILAIAYLRALLKEQFNLTPHAVLRVGAEDHDLSLTPSQIPSAAALRKAIFEGKINTMSTFLPPFEVEMLQKESTAGRFPASLDLASPAILWSLRQTDKATVSKIAEAGGGLGNRLCAVANEASDLAELVALAATKKYPNARLRRAALFAATGVEKSHLSAPPAYVRLLAANDAGMAFLASVRKTAAIPVVTSNSGIPTTAAANRQTELAKRAAALYALCFPKPVSPADLLRQNPLILHEKAGKNP